MKERLAQLYKNGQEGISPSISIDGILNAVTNGWITLDDALEIVGEDASIAVVRAAKIKEISKACGALIVNGIDVEFDGEKYHFNLSLEDQANINNLFRVVELGGTEFPYQADDGTCKVYTAKQIAAIYIAAQTLITTQTTYHNALKQYVQSLRSVNTISKVTYGMDLPEKYASSVAEKLAIAKEQMDAIIARLGG